MQFTAESQKMIDELTAFLVDNKFRIYIQTYNKRGKNRALFGDYKMNENQTVSKRNNPTLQKKDLRKKNIGFARTNRFPI